MPYRALGLALTSRRRVLENAQLASAASRGESSGRSRGNPRCTPAGFILMKELLPVVPLPARDVEHVSHFNKNL
jgi:hypothetical protein